ncbi:MAG: hypothetical protein ACKO37_01110 [Vampirovibrionales bacterium]
MMSYTTLLSFMADVFRQCYLDGQLVSFSASQPFPYSLASSLMQLLVEDLNQAGWFEWQRTERILPAPKTLHTQLTPPYWAWDVASLGLRGSRLRELVLKQTRPSSEETFQGGIPCTPEAFATRFPSTRQAASTGELPSLAWCVVDGELRLAPRQANMAWGATGYEVTLWYDACIELPETLTPSTSMPVPPEGEALLRYGLMSRLYERLGRLPEAQLAEARYQGLLKKLRYRSSMPTHTFTRQMPPLF